MTLLRWTPEAPRLLSHHHVFDVLETPFRREDGLERTMTVLACPDWANVVAITDDDRLVLVRQFRPGPCVETLETPGGVIDGDETPLEAAIRELAEETGYVAKSIEPLGSPFANPALQDNRIHFFLALGATRAHAPRFDEGGEECEVVLVPRADLPRLLENGVFSHALCWAAVARASLRLSQILGDRA